MSAIRLLDAGRRRLLARLVANGLLQSLAMVGSAWAAQQAFDRWILGEPGAVLPLLSPAWLLAGCCLALAALRCHERGTAERLGQDLVGSVRLVLFDRLGRLPPRAIRRRSRGGHLLRFIGDLTALRQWASMGLSRLVVGGLALGLALPALALIDLRIALAVTAVVLATGAVVLALGPGLREAVREARRCRARLAGNVSETLSAMDTVQVFGQLGRERRRLKRRSARLAGAMIRRARRLGAVRGVTEAGSGLATLAILAAGAGAVASGETSPGAVIAGLTVLGLAMPLLRDLSRVHEHWHGYRVAMDNIRAVLDGPGHGPELRRGRRRLPAQADGAILLESVRGADALDGVSLEAAPGERVVVVGGNGAGKSTLLALIARLTDVDGGRVRIDGRDTARCRLNAVRRVVGLAGPDLPLMRGTLARNLRYRCPEASEEALTEAIELAGAGELLGRLPGGLDARIRQRR